MCEQCLVNPVYFGEVLPGYNLARARRDGNDWKKGEWGLIECNDPTYRWTSVPKETEWYMDIPDDFIEGITANQPAFFTYKLVKTAIEAGYTEDENFELWLFNHIAKFLETAEGTTDEDPFPSREEFAPTDYSIYKD